MPVPYLAVGGGPNQNAGRRQERRKRKWGNSVMGKRTSTTKFAIGDVVRHRIFPFRGVIYDIDPQFANTEEWYQAIPAEIRPRKDQPFYHLFAENTDGTYEAYVSEQNLVADGENGPLRHPMADAMFDGFEDGRYRRRSSAMN
jgi:heat shock protein HspQ